MSLITPQDLDGFISGVPEAKLQRMIDDAEADAYRVAPCLSNLAIALADDVDRLLLVSAQVRSILRAALTRWAESGSGAFTQHTQSAGSFSESYSTDTRQRRAGMFWPSEVTALQDICKAVTGATSKRAFNIDQVAPMAASGHTPWCSVTWGDWCSCGAYLTRGEYPLYEQAPRV